MTQVPFFRVELGDEEIAETIDTLKSGWLTTGPKTRRFEEAFAQATGATHAIALNSCTAALHLAVEALGLAPGDGVLVPAMTFAATAEVVRYLGAIPILVDCEPDTLNLDWQHAEAVLADLAAGRCPPGTNAATRVVGVIPVHYGGYMVDMDVARRFADRHGLWVVEDAAHAFPAAWRASASEPWRRCGERTSDIACFSFYANKTLTTGEGGMAVTSSEELAARMRLMSLHGLSRDAWDRYSAAGTWDYRIVAPGFKYNLTDVAASIGIHQLARADALRDERARRVAWYDERLAASPFITRPVRDDSRQHAWHLYPVQLDVESLPVTRDQVMTGMRSRGVTCSVHWRPLHLHPYYQERFGYGPAHCPVATRLFERNLSLPLFPTLGVSEVDHVVDSLVHACRTPTS